MAEQEPARTPAEIALHCVEFLRDQALQASLDEIVAIDGGFAWWPGPTRQQVTATVLETEVRAVEVSVSIDVWRTDDPRHQALQAMQLQGAMSALTLDDSLVQLRTSMLVYPELVDRQLRMLAWSAAST